MISIIRLPSLLVTLSAQEKHNLFPKFALMIISPLLPIRLYHKGFSIPLPGIHILISTNKTLTSGPFFPSGLLNQSRYAALCRRRLPDWLFLFILEIRLLNKQSRHAFLFILHLY
jgi:hypothetical protein